MRHKFVDNVFCRFSERDAERRTKNALAAVIAAFHYSRLGCAPGKLPATVIGVHDVDGLRIFLPRDAMHKRGLCRHAVSVYVSATFVNCVKTNKHIVNVFIPSGRSVILVFPC